MSRMPPWRGCATLAVGLRKEVFVPSEMLTTNERAVTQPTLANAPDAAIRDWARKHVERVRRLKLHLATFVLGMVVLTPVWLFVEWQDNGGFERWSNDGNPGDWEPWILWVALIWGFVLGLMALRTYFDRPATEAEIDREVSRHTSHP